MAVAACFGGPVLNLLMGTGVPVLGASFKHGILPFKLTHGVVALFLETVRVGQAALVGAAFAAVHYIEWRRMSVCTSLPGATAAATSIHQPRIRYLP